MKTFFAMLFSFLFSILLVSVAFAAGTEVSYGKSYSLITSASDAYPDDSIKLTDGIYGTIPDGKTNYYSNPAYVGFNQVNVNEEGNFVIILDLKQRYEDLSGFTVGFLNEPAVGIYAPKSVSFELADDRNGEYTLLGSLDTAKSTESDVSETYAMTLATDDSAGRFLRVTITQLGEFKDAEGNTKTAGWTFIDEISVYSSGNATDDSSDESSQAGESSGVTSEEEQTSEPEPIVPGDSATGIFVFVLLALSSLAMMGALFAHKKQRDF